MHVLEGMCILIFDDVGIDAKESPHDICLLWLQNLFIERVVSLMRFSMELYMDYYVGNAGSKLWYYKIIALHDYIFASCSCEQSDFCDYQGVI